MRFLAILFSLLVFAGPVRAETVKTILFDEGDPVVMQDGYAYLIARQIVRRSENFRSDFAFVRSLSEEELKAAARQYQEDKHFDQESNVVVLIGREYYNADKDVFTYVMAVRPGTYVLGEQANGINGTCLCLGSVKFDAKPGALTDLGYLLIARNDKPSTVPELANAVQKIAPDSDEVAWLVALRPATNETPVPDKLKALPRTFAEYHAVNKFPNHFGRFVDRLAPIAGVLGYDDIGNVLDLRTGQTADSVGPR